LKIMKNQVRGFRFRSEVEGLGIINLNIIDQRSRLDAFEEWVKSQIEGVDVHITTDPSVPELGWLTVGDHKSHKAQAIERLKELMADGPYHVTVFGDQVNDIHMFEAADRAIAVENADAPLLERASQVIGPHWEDSVARFIAAEWIEMGKTDKADEDTNG